ncbi:unnamed protein product [marine sediment metagenome]|uniref:Uncharacterized protein n=1 Tax=marine sediment metagenome TaxID=412755 RepID=X0S8C7_9ZZZZ
MRASGPDRRFQYVIRAPADSVTDRYLTVLLMALASQPECVV